MHFNYLFKEDKLINEPLLPMNETGFYYGSPAGLILTDEPDHLEGHESSPSLVF